MTIRVFTAAGFVPVLEQVRNDLREEAGMDIQYEAGGSVEICRKISELGRGCDMVLLSDSALFDKMLKSQCRWKKEFASEKMVLGVGVRAKKVEDAEKDWTGVVVDNDVRMARVNENTAPAGYRALMVLKLKELSGVNGLYSNYMSNCRMIVDDVSKLTVLLKNGEADYAILYKSSCIANDIRYIEIGDQYDLSSASNDYSKAVVEFDRLKAGVTEKVVMKGDQAVWALSIPETAAGKELANRFIDYLLKNKAEVIRANGFNLITPAKEVDL